MGGFESEVHPMNTTYTPKRYKLHRVIAALVAALVLLPAISSDSQTTLEVPLGLKESPIELTLSPLLADKNRTEYQKISEKLDLKTSDEMITIMVLTMSNPLPIPVTTTLADVVPITGLTRHIFATYMVEEPDTGRPTYLLPDWGTELQIEKDLELTLRLAFILEKGGHAAFERTLKVYACFKHSVIQDNYYSISISRRVEPSTTRVAEEAKADEDDYVSTEKTPQIRFQLSKRLNRVSVRELRPPTTPMSPGGKSVFIEALLGAEGTDNRLPYWIGIPIAIEAGAFDYHTAMQFMNHVSDYRDRFPNKLSRTTIWRNQQRILIVPTEHRVYVATSVFGVCTLPHDVAEVLLYVAEESLALGLHPTDIAAKPACYTPVISTNPGEIIAFDLVCARGVKIRADRDGNDFKIKVTDAEGNESPIPLTYHRK
jgi:hypothetical protein